MSRRTLILLVLLLVVTRGLLVVSLSDVFFYGEELGKGAAAKALLDGIGVEHHKLAYVYHEGGGFIITHLKALAFLLVGENVLAHKLVAIVLTSILLVLGLRFTDANFGPRAAALFGLLFVFCPDAFLRFSLLNLGTHYEALIFIVLILHYCFRILASATVDVRDHVLLGLSAGLGLYFSLQTAPAIACAGVYLLHARRRRFLDRASLFAALAFVVGATPLWIMLGQVGDAALRVRGQTPNTTPTSFFDSLTGLLVPLESHGSWFHWLGVATQPLLIGVALAIANRARDPESKRLYAASERIVGFLTLFLLLYCASGMAVEGSELWVFFWRLCSLWFFVTVLLAASVAYLSRGPRAWLRGAAIGVGALVFVWGVRDFVRLVRDGHPGPFAENVRILTRTKGYDYSEYFDKFRLHLDGNEERKIAVLRRFKDDPHLLFPAINFSLFENSRFRVDVPQALAICERAYGDGWRWSLLGLGHFVHPDGNYHVPEAFGRIESVPEQVQLLLAEGIGRAGLGPYFRPYRIAAQLEIEIDPRFRKHYVRGAGYRVYRAFMLRPDLALEFIRQQHAEDQVALMEGYAMAMDANSLP